MSEFEGHTPGPWRWTVSDRICSDADESPVMVCRLPLSTDKRGDTPQQTIDRWKADARLIAAAPGLLAERDRLVAENERLREWQEFVRYNSKEAAHAADEETTNREGARGGKE